MLVATEPRPWTGAQMRMRANVKVRPCFLVTVNILCLVIVIICTRGGHPAVLAVMWRRNKRGDRTPSGSQCTTAGGTAVIFHGEMDLCCRVARAVSFRPARSRDLRKFSSAVLCLCGLSSLSERREVGSSFLHFLCFLLLNLFLLSNTLRPAGRKTRARKYKKLCWKFSTMELAVCVSLGWKC